MAIRTGQEYLAGIRDDREVWLDGERVDDVTTHPKLARMAQTVAAIYDLQHDPDLRDQMTFTSPTSGEPVSLSYMVPHSQEDLARRKHALEIIAGSVNGMLGRTPDYVNICVVAARQMAHLYGRNDSRFGDNMVAYHEYVRENDLCLTHTFGHPQVNRSVAISELPDPYIAVGIVDTTDEGVIVRGAKLLATLAPFSDEIFAPVYRPLREDAPEDEPYCIGFSIPVNTPGLKFICRQAYDDGKSLYDYPLSGRYDEMDCLAIFDDVLIPWDRVFSFRDVALSNEAVQKVTLWRQYAQQVAVKNVAKLELILGMVRRITEGIGISRFDQVREKISEIIDILATNNAFLRAAEADAEPVDGGLGEGIWLASEPLIAMRHWYPDAYQRVTQIIQQLCAGGLMLTPSEADVKGPLSADIEKFYQGADLAAKDRIQLFRLAWDLIGTEFGSRQTLYERYFNGDIVQLRQRRFASYNYSRAEAALASFFDKLQADD
ncbi:MAG: 4-hydroxyphenylacetate 3-monooxygenase, oxygenase component [SAR202 cluster bacterium Casp-Chloro-G4]|nr:4-hydroxyphenylacetate 3-monooxygenase, oxygenase component [Chloroflexota bacterium]MDA1226391.1 4-hydroxyphenylacetate 3-monooxygenase, oxygenase component [Chloroflexota bacterium]PKB61227.1 MAG: 4-hydroxyphenylacetate 3-monooxygenase, oxygenase component [SAR202 cluster bacterium Casp-Chloro-G4]